MSKAAGGHWPSRPGRSVQRPDMDAINRREFNAITATGAVASGALLEPAAVVARMTGVFAAGPPGWSASRTKIWPSIACR
ncbi:MAG TPA: hypothetical protein VN519_08540 [Bryobacteraceae bacterium]|nr:hypothetical protein [Bryobacteraceae bacterium]